VELGSSTQGGFHVVPYFSVIVPNIVSRIRIHTVHTTTITPFPSNTPDGETEEVGCTLSAWLEPKGVVA
jgi:hypothetical protein